MSSLGITSLSFKLMNTLCEQLTCTGHDLAAGKVAPFRRYSDIAAMRVPWIRRHSPCRPLIKWIVTAWLGFIGCSASNYLRIVWRPNISSAINQASDYRIYMGIITRSGCEKAGVERASCVSRRVIAWAGVELIRTKLLDHWADPWLLCMGLTVSEKLNKHWRNGWPIYT